MIRTLINIGPIVLETARDTGQQLILLRIDVVGKITQYARLLQSSQAGRHLRIRCALEFAGLDFVDVDCRATQAALYGRSCSFVK